MVLPKPDLDVQDEVADVEAEARTEARSLKFNAEAAWSEAKQRFGDDLDRLTAVALPAMATGGKHAGDASAGPGERCGTANAA